MMQEGGPASYGADFRGTGRKREDEYRRSLEMSDRKAADPEQSDPVNSDQNERFIPSIFGPAQSVPTTAAQGVGSLLDSENYKRFNPRASDPFQGMRTKIISGPFGDMEVPVTYEGNTYGGSGSTFDAQGNVSGTMPIQPETFVPVDDPYARADDDKLPSIFGTTGTTGTTVPLNMLPGGMFQAPPMQSSPPVQTAPLPASEIYPNVITPVERDPVFPSYDDPVVVNNPFVGPVNGIQAPPTSPFQNDMVSILPMPVPDAPSPPVYEPYLRDRTRVPFQQGIGSFVR